ncbi:hypothetical protein WAI453_005373 [Rhynchosporium graminicola]
MVRIISAIASFLALVAATEACAGWRQCKMANGDHCCVIDGGFEPSSCPSRCTGGARLAECISQSAGNVRGACSCNKDGVCT